MKRLSICSALLVPVFFLTPAFAQQQNTPQQGRPHKPPPEAVAACSGKSDGTACSFQAPHGQVTGTCKTFENHIACRPPKPPPGQFGGQGQGQGPQGPGQNSGMPQGQGNSQ